MKKTYIQLPFYCLFITINLQSQEWAPIGAEWRYRSELSPTNEVRYELIRVEKDTIVAGQQCRKYVTYNDFGFTFERNDSVFFWHQDDFYLRYDFSALPSDTILIPTPDFGYEPNTTDSFIVVVDSITTELIGLSQTPLEKYHTHSIAGTLDYYDNGYYKTIGSKSVWGGLTTDGIVLGLIYNDLRCYKDDIIEISGIDMSCGLPDASVDLLNQFSIDVFPNPVYNNLQLYLSDDFDGRMYHWQLLDAFGRVVFEKKISSAALVTVPLTSLSKGIYFWQLSKDGVLVDSGKLIKQ